MMLSRAPLPRTDPEAQGVSSARLLARLRELTANENEIHGVMIARNGCVISESWPLPFRADMPHTNHSMGKSYTCTAIGIACAQGLLSPEDRVADLMREELDRFGITPDANFQKMRLRDVMAMANGMTRMARFDEAWLENWLRFPVEREPGTYFHYNTCSASMLGVLVEKVTGVPLRQYLQANLLDCIGVGEQDLRWLRFGSEYYAEPGVSATTEANLRLGLFYLCGGKAEGRQILQPEWLREATRKQVDTSHHNDMQESTHGYGWQLWMCSKPGVYRFDGGQGQFCLMDPEKQAVISLHEGGVHPGGVYKTLTVLQQILYEMEDAPLPPDPDALAQLRGFERGRALPLGRTAPLPADPHAMDGVYAVCQGDANFWIEAFPDGEEFYHLFYDPSIQWSMKTIGLAYRDGYIQMVVNRRCVFRVRLDGQYDVTDTLNPLPELQKTWTTGRFVNDHTLEMEIHWLNAWMVWKATLALEGTTLRIHVAKDPRHEGKPPVERQATARLIRPGPWKGAV